MCYCLAYSIGKLSFVICKISNVRIAHTSVAQAHKFYVHLEMVRTEILIVVALYLIDVRFILCVLSEYVFLKGYCLVLYNVISNNN